MLKIEQDKKQDFRDLAERFYKFASNEVDASGGKGSEHFCTALTLLAHAVGNISRLVALPEEAVKQIGESVLAVLHEQNKQKDADDELRD